MVQDLILKDFPFSFLFFFPFFLFFSGSFEQHLERNRLTGSSRDEDVLPLQWLTKQDQTHCTSVGWVAQAGHGSSAQ